MSTSYHESRIKQADEKQRIYEETIAELQTEERFRDYLDKYSEESVKDFIEHYAKQKAQWIVNGDTMVNLRKHHETWCIKNAFTVLRHIQLKKLINQECEWRAEKIKLKEIEICLDYFLWRDRVLDCPFIKPVSEEELNLYISFLNELSDEMSFEDWAIGGDYRNIKEGFFKIGEHYSPYPAWYAYYDEHFGTADLLYLPDLRGDKEEFYQDLWRAEMKPKWDAQNAAIDHKPPISNLHDKKFAEWFLKEFETKEMLKQYRHTRQWDEKQERYEDIEMDLVNLGEADRDVPVADDDNWQNGIKRGAEKYYRQRTIEVLPGIWKLYQKRIAAGTPAIEKDDFKSLDNESSWMGDFRDKVLDNILRGRELNNEPRDLNF